MLLNGKPLKMLIFFKTIRWINLVIIASTMVVIKFVLIEPLLGYKEIASQLSTSIFSLVVLATLLISAAGYVINDYFDLEIDKINKPEKKHMSEKVLYVIYWVLNISGLAVAAYLYYYFQNSNILIFFIFVSGALWFYSSQYKQQLIIGNVIVAVLTAFVPFLVLWLEMYLIGQSFGHKLQILGISLTYVVWWVVGFSFYAFMLTLIREIVKDIEDFEGDRAFGCHSIPIAFGVGVAKIVVWALLSITIVSLFYIYANFLREGITLTYIILLLVLPLLYAGIKLFAYKTAKELKQISVLLKIIMVFGLAYAFVAMHLLGNL